MKYEQILNAEMDQILNIVRINECLLVKAKILFYFIRMKIKMSKC